MYLSTIIVRGGVMKRCIVFFAYAVLVFGGALKEDGLPGVEVEVSGKGVRCITEPSGKTIAPTIQTNSFNNSRAEILWVDRNHQNAIAEHVSISGSGMWIQAGWYLNNERTSLYRTLGTNTPDWSYLMSNADFFIPVDISFSGQDIGVTSSGEPYHSFSASSPSPQWLYYFPDGFTAATSMQGSAVAVNDDGTIYAVLGSRIAEGRLFILSNTGDTIRSLSFNPTRGIYGLDATGDCSVFCVSTYDAIYIYNLDGSRRDSLFQYGQTVAKISDDGKYVVRGDFYGRVSLYRWDGAEYDLVWQHYVGHPWVTAVAVSDDGSTIMAGTFQYTPSNTGKVLMYDSSSATPLWEYDQYGDYVANCALSADGSRCVAGSWGQYNGTFGDVITVFEKTSSTPLLQVLDDIDEPGSIFNVDIAGDGSFITAGGKAVHAREMGNGGQVYAIQIRDALSNDVGVEAITIPGSFLQVGQMFTPQAVVKNYGTEQASFNTICTISDSTYAELYTDTVFVSALGSGSSQTVDFSASWSVPYYGRFETVVQTTLAGDEFLGNDILMKNSICYHDGAVTGIYYPFSEITLYYAKSPRVAVTNWGSYTENIPVSCEIYDHLNTLVYTGSGQAYLSPLHTARIILTPTWVPSDTGFYTSYVYTQVTDDFSPLNDTMTTVTNTTTEIFYDDGFLDTYGYVSGDFYDNKFAEKMIPCLSAPYYIKRARFYVSGAYPIIMSLNSDSSGLPGLSPVYYVAPAETIYPVESGWVVKEYTPPIQMTDTNPIWFITHWLATSPTAPYIGMDNTQPLDSLSYWYWTESSTPGWHQWPFYDFMMRVFTATDVGIQTREGDRVQRFILHSPSPNPFTQKISLTFSVPTKGSVKATVYDITGRRVVRLTEGLREPGKHRLEWSGSDSNGKKLSTGIYFLKVDYEQESTTKKLILITR